MQGRSLNTSTFMVMVEDYAGLDDEAEIQALEALWVAEYGVVSPNVTGPFDEDLLETGREVNEGNCMDCHTASQWAFSGYSLALLQNSIWYKRNWSATLRSVFDGLIYALLTAGIFGWLWPGN